MTIPRLPGNGPWRILDECPAPAHNSLRAHVGRTSRDKVRAPRCICPRSGALHQIDRARKNKTVMRNPKPVNATPRGALAAHRAAPDLSGAPCTTPRGAALVDHYQRAVGHAQAPVARAVKWMCNARCELREKCLNYALRYEDPPGSWRNIYGGMTAAERKVMASAPNSSEPERDGMSHLYDCCPARPDEPHTEDCPLSEVRCG